MLFAPNSPKTPPSIDYAATFDSLDIMEKVVRHFGDSQSLSASLRCTGGKIWVESQPGQGSTFTFTLPVIVERQVEAA